MSKVVLFSPIGGTDPISETNYFDGSMLHICRHYKPDVVYLYLSKEILKKHETDDRYRFFLNRLYEKHEKDVQIIPIKKNELEDVSDYKLVYNFLLKDIQQVIDILEDGDTLLVNVSSGPPTIKIDLQLLEAIGKFDKPNGKNVQTKLIQVKTPVKRMNEHHHKKNIDKNELEIMWVLNETAESEVNYENRCYEDVFIVTKVLQEESIKHLIRAYNYTAAFEIAKGMKSLSEPYIKYIEGAVNRNKLDYSKAIKAFQDATNLREIFPFQDGDKIAIFEYIQNVEIKYLRGELADFIRSISPVVLKLFLLILKKNEVDINKLSKDVRGKLYWDKKSLKDEQCILYNLQNCYSDFKPEGYIKSDHLQKIIDFLSPNKDIKDLVKQIRKIEDEVRNKAAHEIIKIDEEYIKKKADNKTPKDICDILKKLFSYACRELKKEAWESYDRMNDYIIEKIK